jgi:hypothetical protein
MGVPHGKLEGFVRPSVAVGAQGAAQKPRGNLLRAPLLFDAVSDVNPVIATRLTPDDDRLACRDVGRLLPEVLWEFELLLPHAFERLAERLPQLVRVSGRNLQLLQAPALPELNYV